MGFFDHELIASLGGGTQINVPVVFNGECIGTINLTHRAGQYTAIWLVQKLSRRGSSPVDVRSGKIEQADQVVDLAGKTVIPGLIDGHVHVIATKLDLGAKADLPNSLVALRSAKIMEGMLMRGFTTVRDLGGADHGLVEV